MASVNRQIALASRPVGFPKLSDFQLSEASMLWPSRGQVLVQTIYLSVDPYMRGRMSEAESYAPPLSIGDIMPGGAVGRVLESADQRFAVGALVQGMLGWQQYAVIDGNDLRLIEAGGAPIETALGVLGMPGLTAYFGLLDICHPKAGQTVVVSGAAGAVGMLAGQIAGIMGCEVIGVAGSEAKVAFLVQELGFDGAFNYKTTTDYTAELRRLCPRGIDVYFDNVGGPISDAVFGLINVNARVSVCGQSSQYNLETPSTGPRWLSQLVVKRARVQGFLVSDYQQRFSEGLQGMGQWLKQGRLKHPEDVAQGLENAPSAFIGMLRGENLGKQLVQVSEWTA
ncbi:MAG: NADP-dependent oxidoreductase [Vicinamibacteria bacterium]|nr:NADP-dependent oxidoreductase [Vicinamibacteria bacterium]